MANFKENKKYHYTYKTTNLINGRYYLGMHSTNQLNDGYLGSGKRLYYELNKYGKENFKFEILEQFNSREELVQAEINLITEEDIKNSNCLNLKPGGQGGFTDENRMSNQERKERFLKKLLTDPDFRKQNSEIHRQQLKDRWEIGMFSNRNSATFKGRKHKPETIELMKKSKQETGKGCNNSQFGTCWITNEIESKKIKKGDLIPEGWRLGRKINTSSK